jgi:hypothetical protein
MRRMMTDPKVVVGLANLRKAEDFYLAAATTATTTDAIDLLNAIRFMTMGLEDVLEGLSNRIEHLHQKMEGIEKAIGVGSNSPRLR